MAAIAFREVQAYTSRWFGVFVALGIVALLGVGSALYMEHNGHHVTGMTNQIVWGMPHVFAVFLIVAASGALNIASISSVFAKHAYKPLAPLSALLAISLLAGGLMVLVLDLGRPDRLLIAMTHYNFKSIFAWNIILYNGFFAVVAVYLWVMMDRKLYKDYGRLAGFAAFVWRIILTTGTGSIFGFLVARDAYNAAIMAPEFIALSFAYGLAIMLLVLLGAFALTEREIGEATMKRLRNLLVTFIAAGIYFVAVQHLTNLYQAERAAASAFILFNGGIHTFLFWVVQIGIGGLVPMFILAYPGLRENRGMVGVASVLVVLGGLAQMYVTIIGGQAIPLTIFPGKEVSSSFFDGMVNEYAATAPELLLGISGFAVALIIVALGCTVLRFLPATLADEAVAEH
jgi:molybdopterin-containing oxidoreductase family membrane subunit